MIDFWEVRPFILSTSVSPTPHWMPFLPSFPPSTLGYFKPPDRIPRFFVNYKKNAHLTWLLDIPIVI